MDAHRLTALLGAQHPFARQLILLPQVDSTNTHLMGLARAGAPEGTVVLADRQTAGRGTRGRSFHSLADRGLYLSLLLRPQVELEQLLTLTGWVAVAVCEGIGAACGAPCRIKWLNDLYLNGRKLCGILTEFLPPEGDRPPCVVVGIGVNLTQSPEEFAACGLEHIATSLAMEGFRVDREELAAHILRALEEMLRQFPQQQAPWLERYRRLCLTPGRRVSFEAEGKLHTGLALELNPDFSLVASDEEGRRHILSAGTVTLI